MSSILILGDVHLGGGLNQGRQASGFALNSRIIDRLNLLDWTYEQALSNDVSHIILTGDVFDDPKPHHTLIFLLLEWLKKCSDDNIHIHIVAGNHDLLRSGQFTTSPLDIISSSDIKNVFIYKRIDTLFLNDVGVTFLPFRDRRSFNTNSNTEALNLLKAQLPYEINSMDNNLLKILVGHLAIEGAIPVGSELDELTNELLCPLDMFNGYDYVWMGHIHKFQIMSQIPYVAHIGSMDISDFGETDQCKYIVIINPNSKDKFTYHQIPTRPLKHFVVDVPESETNVSQYIDNMIKEQNFTDAIVKLTIKLPNTVSSFIDRNNIEKHIYEMGAFHISKISEERKFISRKANISTNIDNSSNELSAIKIYSSLIDESLREDFISVATNIIQEYKENIK